MDEALKNRIVIILAVLSVVLLFSTFSSCNSAKHKDIEYAKERITRVTLEEKTSKYAQERTVLEEKVKAQENQLQELKASLEVTKKSLVQNQLVSLSLKEELQKVTKLKETLEEELKQALENVKKAKK